MYIEEYYGQLYQMLSSGPNECQCQSHLCLNVEKFHQLHQLKLVLLNDFCEIQIGNHKGSYGHLKIVYSNCHYSFQQFIKNI